jgi:radical SAM protein with 4Fe4S-binding SPASM domain
MAGKQAQEQLSLKSSPSFESRALPKTFVLELTQHRNHHCMNCYTPWRAPELDYHPDCAGEGSTVKILEIIARLQNEVPVEHVAFSGGEPLLRQDLPEILSFTRERGICPTIISNGTLLSQERVRATAAETTYEFTLLSYRREVHERLAGRRGDWDAVVDGMANVRQAGGTPVAAFVATKLNFMDLFKTAELAIALGATGLMYNRINLGAHTIRYVDQLLPTPAMIRENLDMLEDLGRTYGLTIAVSVVIEPCVVDVRNYRHIHFGWCPLAGEDSHFTIDPTGNVRICSHSPVILGNIWRDRFVDIYYHHPYVRSFYDTWPGECAHCDPQLKEICRGGCKAAAEQCYGTLKRVDPFVTFSRQWAASARDRQLCKVQ